MPGWKPSLPKGPLLTGAWAGEVDSEVDGQPPLFELLLGKRGWD